MSVYINEYTHTHICTHRVRERERARDWIEPDLQISSIFRL